MIFSYYLDSRFHGKDMQKTIFFKKLNCYPFQYRIHSASRQILFCNYFIFEISFHLIVS